MIFRAVPLPVNGSNETTTSPLETKDEVLSEELIIVITVCATVVIMGIGVVVKYVLLMKNSYAR